MAKRVTVYEIASACGVSQPTVSRILGGGAAAGRHSVDTRKLVLDTAARMGYRPNAAARAIGRNHFGAIGLLLSSRPRLSNLPQPFLESVLEAAAEDDLNLALLKYDDATLSDGARVPRLLRESSTDGLLIDYTHDIPKPLIDIVDRQSIPVIWLNSKQPADCIRPDDVDAGFRATQLLLDAGHRKITFIDLHHGESIEGRHFSVGDRREGYSRAMTQAGLQPRLLHAGAEDTVYKTKRTRFCIDVLSRSDRPTAVVTYGSPLHVVSATLSLGMEVPSDLAFVSIGESLNTLLDVDFTTLATPHRQFGRAAVDMLMTKVKRPNQRLEPRLVKMDLIIGGTA
ncbi:MAG: LacI family DNA-binding transcriptional regulator [Planctomycetota bacterium]